jgi:hypothetical protein
MNGWQIMRRAEAVAAIHFNNGAYHEEAPEGAEEYSRYDERSGRGKRARERGREKGEKERAAHTTACYAYASLRSPHTRLQLHFRP